VDKNARILIACEESGAVTDAFIELGFTNVWSCDLQPCSGKNPDHHLQTDVVELLKEEWEMIIAFPPCTHLAVSGAAHFAKKRADGRQQEGIDFFMLFTDLKCPRVVIENPVGIMSSIYKEPTQIIQPYQFGHEARKSTCLWIKGLQPLEYTNIVGMGEIGPGGFSVGAGFYKLKDENGKSIAYDDPRTAKIRSKTFPGIAKAMATQWGDENWKPKQIRLEDI
jgi:hypothetical protein